MAELSGASEYNPFCGGCWAFGARIVYWRKVLRMLEIGVSLTFWHDTYPEEKAYAWFGALGLRPYLPFAKDELEIALPIHFGAQAVQIPDVPGSWVGLGFGAGPEFRGWVNQHFAVFLGGDFSIVPAAHNPSVAERENELFVNKTMEVGSINAWAGALGAF